MIEKSLWHQREPTLEQDRKFKRLLALHQLTSAWTQALTSLDTPSFSMERMPKITLQQNLWLLEKTRLDEISLDLRTLVGAEDINVFLSELAESIWLIQLSTLENALSQTTDISLLVNIFKTTSWSHGKKIAEKEWPHAGIHDLTKAYHAFLETHSDEPSSFLLAQTTKDSLSFFWSRSPYSKANIKESPQIKLLTEMHEEWIHGFFYGLSRTIKASSRTILHDGTQPWVEFNLLSTY